MALSHFHLTLILFPKSCTLSFFLRTFALREEEERRKDRKELGNQKSGFIANI
jgi:hypothetical protein